MPRPGDKGRFDLGALRPREICLELDRAATRVVVLGVQPEPDDGHRARAPVAAEIRRREELRELLVDLFVRVVRAALDEHGRVAALPVQVAPEGVPDVAEVQVPAALERGGGGLVFAHVAREDVPAPRDDEAGLALAARH